MNTVPSKQFTKVRCVLMKTTDLPDASSSNFDEYFASIWSIWPISFIRKVLQEVFCANFQFAVYGRQFHTFSSKIMTATLRPYPHCSLWLFHYCALCSYAKTDSVGEIAKSFVWSKIINNPVTPQHKMRLWANASGFGTAWVLLSMSPSVIQEYVRIGWKITLASVERRMSQQSDRLQPADHLVFGKIWKRSGFRDTFRGELGLYCR